MVADLQSGLAQLTQLQEEAATGKADQPALRQPRRHLRGAVAQLPARPLPAVLVQHPDGQSWLRTAGTALGSVTKPSTRCRPTCSPGPTPPPGQRGQPSPSQDVLTIKQEMLEPCRDHVQQPANFFRHIRHAALPPRCGERGQRPDQFLLRPRHRLRLRRQFDPVPAGWCRRAKSVNVSVTGQQVFGSGTSSVFALLDTISQDLANGNTSALSGSDLTQLQTAISTVTQAQGDCRGPRRFPGHGRSRRSAARCHRHPGPGRRPDRRQRGPGGGAAGPGGDVLSGGARNDGQDHPALSRPVPVMTAIAAVRCPIRPTRASRAAFRRRRARFPRGQGLQRQTVGDRAEPFYRPGVPRSGRAAVRRWSGPACSSRGTSPGSVLRSSRPWTPPAPTTCSVLVILTLHSTAEKSTANLLGPLVVNCATGQAVQAVLSGSGYSPARPR